MERAKKYHSQKISKESNSTTPEMVSTKKEISLPTLLSNYDLKDVFNAYEFGVFYKCITNKKMPTEIKKVLMYKVKTWQQQ